jgi:2-methylcitrate dehydratase PrpD
METQPTLQERLASIAHRVARDSIDANAGDSIRAHVLDTLGLIAAAAGSEPWKRASSYLEQQAGERRSAAGVAFLTAAAADAFSLDDFDEVTRLHPGAVVVPAVLAISDDRLTAARFESAVAAGYEVMLRLGEAVGSSGLHDRGAHPTSMLGPMAAAAAAALADRADEAGVAVAIGIAASLSCGIFELDAGNTVKGLQVGAAAANGVRAWQMAKAGYRPSPRALDGERGLLRLVTGDPAPSADLDPSNGCRRLERTSFKPFAHFTDINPATTGLLELLSENAISPAQLSSVHFEFADRVKSKLTIGYPPRNRKEALRSPQWVAACILGGERLPVPNDPLISRLVFAPSRAKDLEAVADRVSWSAVPDPGENSDCSVTLHCQDGTVLRKNVSGYPGDGRDDARRWGVKDVGSRLRALQGAAASLCSAYEAFADGERDLGHVRALLVKSAEAAK